MNKTPTEVWAGYNGLSIGVSVINRYATTEDVCPECNSGIRIAVGKDIESGEQLFRIECLKCGWTSEALPDPRA